MYQMDGGERKTEVREVRDDNKQEKSQKADQRTRVAMQKCKASLWAIATPLRVLLKKEAVWGG